MIGGLVLAAGAGRRFGGRKLLAPLQGRPLLEHALATMAAAAGLRRRIVVLGCDADEILRSVDLHGLEPVVCRDWEEGQAASLRAGLAAMTGAGTPARADAGDGVEAVVVTLGDQPWIEAGAIDRLLASRGPSWEAVRARYDGRPGHPVVLERPLFFGVASLRGDTGARDLLRHARVRDVPCDGVGRPDDIDTREQLELASQPRGAR